MLPKSAVASIAEQREAFRSAGIPQCLADRLTESWQQSLLELLTADDVPAEVLDQIDGDLRVMSEKRPFLERLEKLGARAMARQAARRRRLS